MEVKPESSSISMKKQRLDMKIMIRNMNPVMMIATKMRRNTADEDDKAIYDYIHNDDDDNDDDDDDVYDDDDDDDDKDEDEKTLQK